MKTFIGQQYFYYFCYVISQALKILSLKSVVCRSLPVVRFSAILAAIVLLVCTGAEARAAVDSIVVKGEALIRQGERQGDNAALQEGYGILGEHFLQMDDYARAGKYLDKSWKAWESMGKQVDKGRGDKAVLRMYNSLGILTANADMDYGRATSLLCEGLELALKNKNDRDYAMLAYNMIVIFFIREDTQGRPYARLLYNGGVEASDPFLTTLGAIGMALMASLDRDYEQVEKWLARSEMPRFSDSYIIVPALKGIAAAGLRHTAEAETYFRQALSLVDKASVTEAAFFYFSLGNFLTMQGRYDEAEKAYLDGLEASTTRGNHVFTYRFYRELSALATRRGDNKEALRYFSLYHDEYTRIYSLEQEREVKGLTAKYLEAVHNERIQKAEIEIMRKKRNILVVSMLMVFAVIAAVASMVMYRRKNSLYRRVAMQYHESNATQSRLRAEIERLREARQPNAAIDKEKSEDLFNRLERLMDVDKAYTDSGLTRETVAERLGTNRTYLSQTVSRHTGKNFTAYVNDFRINEVLRLMADSSCDLPLKAIPTVAGFSSPTTFYKFFREKTGMSPAQYRQNVQHIHDTEIAE